MLKLPEALDVERALIGQIVAWGHPAMRDALRSGVTENSFDSDVLGVVFRQALYLFDRDKSVDLVTVGWSTAPELADELGGKSALIELLIESMEFADEYGEDTATCARRVVAEATARTLGGAPC
jgi:replicative DNA helicase